LEAEKIEALVLSRRRVCRWEVPGWSQLWIAQDSRNAWFRGPARDGGIQQGSSWG